MTHLLDHGIGAIARDDLAWMLGNIYLAWAGLLVCWLLVGTRGQRIWAARVLIGAAALGALVVLLVGRDTLKGIPQEWIIVPPLFVAAATAVVLVWGRRHAWVGYVVAAVAISFAPNAPYVLTDTLHLVQDLRVAQLDSAESILLCAQYGVFLILGLVPWILLLALGRRWVRVHWFRGSFREMLLLTAVSAVTAVGIYIGRIERLHSYHLATQPLHVLRSASHVLTHPRPAVFALAWTLVVLLISTLGLWLADRIRAVGGTGRELVVPSMFALTGILLAAVPSVAVWDAQYGLHTATPGGADAAACLLFGIVLGAIGTARLVTVLGLVVERHADPSLDEILQPQPSLVPVFALACVLAVPIIGTTLMGGATLQWWAQYRGLCHFAPARSFDHGDRC